MTRRLIAEFAGRGSAKATAGRKRLEALTEREREVVIAVAQASATPRSASGCT